MRRGARRWEGIKAPEKLTRPSARRLTIIYDLARADGVCPSNRLFLLCKVAINPVDNKYGERRVKRKAGLKMAGKNELISKPFVVAG